MLVVRWAELVRAPTCPWRAAACQLNSKFLTRSHEIARRVGEEARRPRPRRKKKKIAAAMILLLLSTISATSDTYHTYCALRHGQSLANVAGVISSDPRVACIEHGLSDAGRAQADAAAAVVVAAAIEEGVAGVAIVASDLRRAWQTASIVRAHVLAAGVRVWPAAGKPFEERALRERSFGELESVHELHIRCLMKTLKCWVLTRG